MEALATLFPLPAAALLSFLHSAQGTSLVGFPSSRRVMNIPYWGCGSKSLPKKSQISQWSNLPKYPKVLHQICNSLNVSP